ncbi:hypothetical protein KX935_04725 [Streptobacillus moniliformis]|nr:hypothetical protein KX935_04725 [Streptobacillus moniliformis]
MFLSIFLKDITCFPSTFITSDTPQFTLKFSDGNGLGTFASVECAISMKLLNSSK